MRPDSSSHKSTRALIRQIADVYIRCPSESLVDSCFRHQVRQQAESLHEAQCAAPHVSSSQPSPPQPGVWSAAPDVSRAQQNVPRALKLGMLNAKPWLRPSSTVCVRLRQRSPDGDCVPVVMRDTISFLSEQGGSSFLVVITQIERDNKLQLIQLFFLCAPVSVCVRFGDRGDLQALGQRDLGEGSAAQIQLGSVNALKPSRAHTNI